MQHRFGTAECTYQISSLGSGGEGKGRGGGWVLHNQLQKYSCRMNLCTFADLYVSWQGCGGGRD